MTPVAKKARAVLAKSFSVLGDEELDLLEYHLKAKTTICCGVDAGIYTDGRGGG